MILEKPGSFHKAKSATCRRLVAAGALYDLAVVGPLALPFLVLSHLQLLSIINTMFGLRGSMPVFEPVHLLFANLFALFVVMWAAVRLIWFTPKMAAVDLASRLAVSGLLGWYAFQGSVNGIVNLFLVLELILAGLAWVAVKSAFRAEAGGPAA